MYNYRSFLDVFDFDLGGVYTKKQVDEIEGCRRKFEGLFVDKVLKLVGVKRRELFSTTFLYLAQSFGHGGRRMKGCEKVS